MSLAIACASGGYRVTFIQGVLSALENAGIRANVYAGTSGSVIPAALAAVGQHERYGRAYIEGLLEYKSLGEGMSGVFKESIQAWEPLICRQLWQPDSSRLVIPVSAVVTSEAAQQTQGNVKISRRLGRSLLLASARHDRNWVNANLSLALFDTHSVDSDLCLTVDNFNDVAYASSRMLNAWDIPAWIDNRPYIDASYTCSCPALELAAMGYDEVLAISPEFGPVYHDLFRTREIPSIWDVSLIHTIQPDLDLHELEVYCTHTNEAGLLNAYRHGKEKGYTFLKVWYQSDLAPG